MDEWCNYRCPSFAFVLSQWKFKIDSWCIVVFTKVTAVAIFFASVLCELYVLDMLLMCSVCTYDNVCSFFAAMCNLYWFSSRIFARLVASTKQDIVILLALFFLSVCLSISKNCSKSGVNFCRSFGRVFPGTRNIFGGYDLDFKMFLCVLV